MHLSWLAKLLYPSTYSRTRAESGTARTAFDFSREVTEGRVSVCDWVIPRILHKHWLIVPGDPERCVRQSLLHQKSRPPGGTPQGNAELCWITATLVPEKAGNCLNGNKAGDRSQAEGPRSGLSPHLSTQVSFPRATQSDQSKPT